MGQTLLAVAIAVLVAQAISTALVYRAQIERRETTLLHTAAVRLLVAARASTHTPFDGHEHPHSETLSPHPAPPSQHVQQAIQPTEVHTVPASGTTPPNTETTPQLRPGRGPRALRVERRDAFMLRAGEEYETASEYALAQILTEQGLPPLHIKVIRRAVSHDPATMDRLLHEMSLLGDPNPKIEDGQNVFLAGIQLEPDGQWIVARVLVAPDYAHSALVLMGQTLVLYVILMSVIALCLRRITRPLARLTKRIDRFTLSPQARQLPPEGPSDLRRLIIAHNAMENRISALIEEKDVMLGAIGHDLKTPLAALRMRVENVEDDLQRQRMANIIEETVCILDDILSLARIGQPSEDVQATELSALVASLVEEYEDMGQNAELKDFSRVVVEARVVWLQRALRNLIENAMRYGQQARVSVLRDDSHAYVYIEDQGSGIPESEHERMMQPFQRGEPSRNSGTGGTGLGLTLARAITEQHGGTLTLENRRDPNGTITGLRVLMRLPIKAPTD